MAEIVDSTLKDDYFYLESAEEESGLGNSGCKTGED